MSKRIKIYPCKFSEGANPVVDIPFLWIPRAFEPAVLLDQNGQTWRMFRTCQEAAEVYPSAKLTAPLVVRLDEQGIACPVGHCVRVAVKVASDFPMMQDPLFVTVHALPTLKPVYWNEVGLAKMSRVLMFVESAVHVPSKSETMLLVKHLSELKSTTLAFDTVQSSLLKNLDKFTWNNGQIQLVECPLSKGLLWITENGEPPKGAELKGSTYMIAAMLAAAPFAQDTAVVFGTDPDGDALLTVYSMPDLGICLEQSLVLKGIKHTSSDEVDSDAPKKSKKHGLAHLLISGAGMKATKFQDGTSKLDL